MYIPKHDFYFHIANVEFLTFHIALLLRHILNCK